MTPFNEQQAATLEALASCWGARRVVLIGAGALGCHLEMTWRSTEDVDLTAAVEMDEHTAMLEQLDGWRLDAHLEHRIWSPWGVKVDVVPAGPSLLRAGKVVWPKSGHEMNLAGMDLAFAHASAVPVGSTSLLVASLASVLVLKMAAWLDRSTERERDLADIGFVLEEAVGADDERRFDNPIIDLDLPFELVSSYLTGVAVGRIAGKLHMELVTQFLSMVGDEAHWAHGRMRAHSPPAWRHDEAALGARLDAFRRGVARAQGT